MSGCTDGRNPLAGLIQATDGNFYGTTEFEGANDNGTVFKITPSGTLTTLHSFDSTDGSQIIAGVIQATDGNFYGTTEFGGANNDVLCSNLGCGTVFKITPSGTLTTVHSFCSQSGCMDGLTPTAGLIQAIDGNFYGTTGGGGANNGGTVFKITSSGALTTLYSFCSQSGCTDGGGPGGLVQATDGNFYGITQGGGTSNSCVAGCGTVFEITSGGTLTTLYSFCSQSNCADGRQPFAGLVEATDGNFYGTTAAGGTNNFGTVFKITPSGTLTTLHRFDLTDGADVSGSLVQDTNGNLYGTTQGGGANKLGTVFALSVGLGPFVVTRPPSGKVGMAVKILGTNLTGATSVSFNGTAATFTVMSPSLITTTVPVGATTGTVQVVTPSGTLSSNVPFQVLP